MQITGINVSIREGPSKHGLSVKATVKQPATLMAGEHKQRSFAGKIPFFRFRPRQGDPRENRPKMSPAAFKKSRRKFLPEGFGGPGPGPALNHGRASISGHRNRRPASARSRHSIFRSPRLPDFRPVVGSMEVSSFPLPLPNPRCLAHRTCAS